MPAEYYVDYRWFLERQAELLDDLAVSDYSVFVGLAARHRVDPPRHDQHHPDAFWRAAVMLEECVVLRPLPARNELYGFGVAVAYLGMHGERVNTKIRGLAGPDLRHHRPASRLLRRRRAAALAPSAAGLTSLSLSPAGNGLPDP
ncbi:hypothetical protein [Streptomyces coelicolor A3(2)]|uniref:Toxin Doc n=2 Tax=Streptomyces coelicolor TaxID=1902 RepID=Q9ACS1_STRCO|nr:hypothetical protein [Streptomyces sp. NRRL_B-16638]AGO88712.1 hypothetical protein [Streptomyces coelicolor]CAC36773.1 hypothetical protein [Streptomyces coelicolor A3(2)]